MDSLVALYDHVSARFDATDATMCWMSDIDALMMAVNAAMCDSRLLRGNLGPEDGLFEPLALWPCACRYEMLAIPSTVVIIKNQD